MLGHIRWWAVADLGHHPTHAEALAAALAHLRDHHTPANARRKPHDARRAPNRAEATTDTSPRITPLSFVADAYLPEED